MAVVQISKIQHRRGQKNTGSGLPQLASGEIGWAIDTRELYIGNGAVSEGAPAVGNTKVLTEYDNILDFANSYFYRVDDSYIQTGGNSSSPIARSLQERLDDFVSVRAFGAKGDGVTDDTAAIQRAIDQLYLNAANKNSPSSRYQLEFEPGEYIVTDTLFIPPFASLIGSGKQKTVIRSSSAIIMKTVNGLSEPGSPGDDAQTTTSNLPHKIRVQGMTLEGNILCKGLVLQNCKNSVFSDIEILGTWAPADAENTSSVGIEMNALGAEVSSDNNLFENCSIYGYSFGVRSNWDIKYNLFTDCSLDYLHRGFTFGDNILLGSSGKSTGPRRNVISQTYFRNISQQALYIAQGEYNISDSNTFVGIGNDQGAETEAVAPVIRFGVLTNESNSDYFSRTESLLSGGGLTQVPYVPEISGPGFYKLSQENTIEFGAFQNQTLFRLPGVENQSYELEYNILSPLYYRTGKLLIIVDGYNESIEVSDDFHHIGDQAYLCDISFSGSLKNLSATGSKDTIEIKVTASVQDVNERTLTFVTNMRNTDTT